MSAEQSAPLGGTNRRRSTSRDGMILIGGIAIGCAMGRLYYNSFQKQRSFNEYLYPPLYRIDGFTSLLLVLSATLVTIELFIARQAQHGRFRRPGSLAMLMAVIALTYKPLLSTVGLVEIASSTRIDERGQYQLIFFPLREGGQRVGPLILACRFTLHRVGAWRPSKDWQDRSGRAFAVVWICFSVLSSLIDYWTAVRWTSQA